MSRLTIGLMVLLSALPAFAQRDFLTDSEIEQVREAQDPVPRIKLYLLFARQRLDQLKSQMAKDRPGRSGEVRQLLEDYASILDAINTVSDDALIRKGDLTGSQALIANGEMTFLSQLQNIEAAAPHDLDLYDFQLKDAIEATSDSIDLTKQDLGDRTREVDAGVNKAKKEAATINAEERKQGGNTMADKAEAQAAQAANESDKPARKAPTLYRPGEKPADPPQQ